VVHEIWRRRMYRGAILRPHNDELAAVLRTRMHPLHFGNKMPEHMN
jgi:hypothetical protein